MNSKLKITYLIFILFNISIVGYGQDTLTSRQIELIGVMEGLSETTAPEGKGADAYGEFLADDFSRWTLGSELINDKENWVEGVRDWFDDGWRVSKKEQQILEILIMDNYAHTRRIVTETYLGPKGDQSKSKAALTEIWAYRDTEWRLYRVNVYALDND